jgi:hypothetical protein
MKRKRYFQALPKWFYSWVLARSAWLVLSDVVTRSSWAGSLRPSDSFLIRGALNWLDSFNQVGSLRWYDSFPFMGALVSYDSLYFPWSYLPVLVRSVCLVLTQIVTRSSSMVLSTALTRSTLLVHLNERDSFSMCGPLWGCDSLLTTGTL